jgi:hypothetical protein
MELGSRALLVVDVDEGSVEVGKGGKGKSPALALHDVTCRHAPIQLN